MNFLGQILESTRRAVAESKSRVPLEAIRDRPLYRRVPLSLASAIRLRSPAFIAEIKRASPSRGIIARDCDPSRVARAYQNAGASAISVLTEEKHFLGSLGDLESARQAVTIPVLRKDFVIDPYQIHEARAAGADAVLLIAAALRPHEVASLLDEARAIGLECLVEVHSEDELDGLNGIEMPLIGINNRDLVTFETDLGVSAALARRLPGSSLCVSESGIRTPDDVRMLMGAGIGAFLVGEQFMSCPDPGGALAALREGAGERP